MTRLGRNIRFDRWNIRFILSVNGRHTDDITKQKSFTENCVQHVVVHQIPQKSYSTKITWYNIKFYCYRTIERSWQTELQPEPNIFNIFVLLLNQLNQQSVPYKEFWDQSHGISCHHYFQQSRVQFHNDSLKKGILNAFVWNGLKLVMERIRNRYLIF